MRQHHGTCNSAWTRCEGSKISQLGSSRRSAPVIAGDSEQLDSSHSLQGCPPPTIVAPCRAPSKISKTATQHLSRSSSKVERIGAQKASDVAITVRDPRARSHYTSASRDTIQNNWRRASSPAPTFSSGIAKWMHDTPEPSKSRT